MGDRPALFARSEHAAHAARAILVVAALALVGYVCYEGLGLDFISRQQQYIVVSSDPKQQQPGGTAGAVQAFAGPDSESLLARSMDLLSKGKYEVFDGNIETVWQLPTGEPTGVVLVAHGCHHGAVDFWPKSTNCPQCTGLPEEMNVTLHFLNRGYAVLAVSSNDRGISKCWQQIWPPLEGDNSSAAAVSTLPDAQTDWKRVKTVLDKFITRESLGGLPLFAFGGSSGGGFAATLPAHMPARFAGLIVQIMGMLPAHLAGHTARHKAGKAPAPYPPTVFVHMPRDTHLANLITMSIKELQRAGVPTMELQVHAKPLTPLYMWQRCAPEVSQEASKAIYKALSAANYLNKDGFLEHNPRSMLPDWRTILHSEKVPGLGTQIRLGPDLSPVGEELNLLYAQHELCSETTTDSINWLESQLGVKGGATASTAGNHLTVIDGTKRGDYDYGDYEGVEGDYDYDAAEDGEKPEAVDVVDA